MLTNCATGTSNFIFYFENFKLKTKTFQINIENWVTDGKSLNSILMVPGKHSPNCTCNLITAGEARALLEDSYKCHPIRAGVRVIFGWVPSSNNNILH